MSEKAIELILQYVSKGISWIFAIRKVNGMTEEEIDAAITAEEARSNKLMDEWNAG